MRTHRRRLASAATLLALTLTGASGCQTTLGGMTLPSGRYLDHYPQYFAPDPGFPLPRELASQEDPAGEARRAGGPGAPAAGAPIAPGIPGAPNGVPLSGGPR